MLDFIKSLWAKLFGSVAPNTPVVSIPVPPAVVTPVVPIRAPGQADNPTRIYGPDGSHWETGINWAEVASDNAFGITKASQGERNVDQLIVPYKKDMIANLEVCGFYHFYEPGVDPIAQAKHFLATVGPLRQYDFLALDWEPYGGVNEPTLAESLNVDKFLAYVDEQTGKKCWIYCDYDYFENYSFMQKYASRPTWLAYPNRSHVAIPKGWQSVALWQYTFEGIFKGVPQPCDGNVFVGTREDMKALIVKP